MARLFCARDQMIKLESHQDSGITRSVQGTVNAPATISHRNLSSPPSALNPSCTLKPEKSMKRHKIASWACRGEIVALFLHSGCLCPANGLTNSVLSKCLPQVS